ncbi:uncharacterized protein LOC131432608 [Malaya genurostris]|uniref:uncharacterized protein LOC131432608 n=1 Tax=Malaya genurostris TaxID=325434 RepID=UPI0026F3B289|nr:uncharacterized protein LOC131432608 [Malaya genurostris]
MSSVWNQLANKFNNRKKRKSVLETRGHRAVNKKQVSALMQCLEYLSKNISIFGLFLSSGSTNHLERIYRKIEAGDERLLNYLLETSASRECAMAMHRFIRCYKISILPERTLNLLCARNEGIPRRLVALDALNLILHESSGAKFQFAREYLRMMQHLTLRGYLTPNEIRIIISPYLAVPVLFPGRNSMHNIASESAVLMEMFLIAHLLDDPATLSMELALETKRLAQQRRPPTNASNR